MVGSPLKKDKTRIIKAYIVFRTAADPFEPSDVSTEGHSTTKISVQKIVRSKSSSLCNKSDDEDDIDENAITLLALPDGFQTFSSKNDPTSLAFHTFLITRQNGSRLYGSAMLMRDDCEDEDRLTAHCLITTIPFVVAARHLLTYFIQHKVETSLIYRICNLKVPSKGKCLKLLLPGFHQDVIVFRGSVAYPLLDYPLRELLTNVLSPENLSLALIAALLEFQIVILSKDYYQLMLVSESLTSLLLPFSWQHVYVPILPAKLGLNYLDAPTPYIMGLNVNVFSPSLLSSSLSSLSSHTIQCRIFCHENRIEFISSDMEERDVLSLMPAFQSQLSQEINLILRTNVKLTTQVSKIRSKSSVLERVTEVARKHQVLDDSFTYLDDLKLNQLIRMTCMTCLNESVLNDVEKFIVRGGNGSGSLSTGGAPHFDQDSYLSQQPQENRPFLRKFMETQMFASVIDQKYKMLTRRTSSTSCPPEQDHLLLQTSAPIDSLHTVDEFLDEVFQGAFDDATIVNLNEPDISKSCSSPMRQRKVYDLAFKDCPKALPDLRKNSLEAVVQQLEALKKANKTPVPKADDKLSVTVPAFLEKVANDTHPISKVQKASSATAPLESREQAVIDGESEARATASLKAHFKVCEAEKEKLRGQIHRLCQENVLLRDELADSQIKLRSSTKYTIQLEEDKRHLEFLLSMKKYDDFKASMTDAYDRKSSFIDPIALGENHRLPVINLNQHVVRVNPKSPVHPSQASVSNAGVPETPTRLRGLSSRVIQYYNKVLTRIND